MDKSCPRLQKGQSGAFPPSENRLCRASHRASTSLAPYGLPAPCQARHQASNIVTLPTGTALLSAPERGSKALSCRRLPEGNQKMRPRKRARTVRGGTAFPPVALRLRLRTGLDPPCGPAAPRSALRRSAPPAGYPESKVLIRPAALRKRKTGFPACQEAQGEAIKAAARGRARLARLRGLRGLLRGCHFRVHPSA